MIYCTSDTHFGHRKVCHGYDDHFEETRKYDTIEEMEEDIITTWNEFVTEEDTVIFLGDFVFGGAWGFKKQRIIDLWSKLNGKKIWVIGNHDIVVLKHKDEFPDIEFVKEYNLSMDGVNYHFRHHPYNDDEITSLDEVYAHGHTHSTNPWNGKQNCVCWDAWYAPVPVDALKTPNELMAAEKEIGELLTSLNTNGDN